QMSQNLHLQPRAVAARAGARRQRLLGRLDARLHAREIADLPMQTLIEADQNVDRILSPARDGGEERREPRLGGLGIEVGRKRLGEISGIGKREGLREWLEEEVGRNEHS